MDKMAARQGTAMEVAIMRLVEVKNSINIQIIHLESALKGGMPTGSSGSSKKDQAPTLREVLERITDELVESHERIIKIRQAVAEEYGTMRLL